MKRSLLVLAAVVSILLLVVVVRTVLHRPPDSIPGHKVSVADGFASAAKRLAGAIRFPTVSGQDTSRTDTTAFLGLHQFLRAEYPEVHDRLRAEKISDLSLLFTWQGSEAGLAPALIMGHQDVVPPGADSLWAHPPFSGDMESGWVWGRGALDDKIGMISALEAVERLLAEGFRPTRTTYLAFGHDEEVGGARGASVIADTLRSRIGGKLAYVLDEGGFVVDGLLNVIEEPVALVGVAEKGYLSLSLTADGPGGHSSAPPASTTAGRIGRAVARLEADPFPSRIDGATRAMFDHLGPHMSLSRRMVFANLWLFGPVVRSVLTSDPGSAALVRTTTAVTMLSGGVKENVLPSRARAVVNFRILPGETVRSVQDRVMRIVDDPGVHIEPVNVFFGPSPISDTESALFALLERTITETVGDGRTVVAPYLVPGATDSRYFSNMSGEVFRFLPIVVGPEELKTIHGTDERIRVEHVETCATFVYRLIGELDAARRPGRE